MIRKILFLSLLILSGCTSKSVRLNETPLNLSETRKTITVLVGEPRMISENGRELWSIYFDAKGKKIEEPQKARIRYYYHFTILNDRRPYDIDVEALVEGRTDDDAFVVFDRNQPKAQEMALKLKKALNESHSSRNIIDDFKSF